MAKSIRSKIKRKHRAEFRKTVGEKAYQDGMAKVQSKLQETIGKDSSLPSLTKVSNLFHSDDNNIDEDRSTEIPNDDIMAVDAMETTAAVATSTEGLKGENKVPAKKSRKAKQALRKKSASTTTATTTTTTTKRERPKPRFFCQF